MSWVVDTCVLIDILVDDPDFGRPSALSLRNYLSQGLVLSPVTMIELSPAFEGDLLKQKEFLSLCGVGYGAAFVSEDIVCAHTAWHRYIQKKRLQKIPKRPVADLMIGAFATRFDGLITRNPKDFKPWFTDLKLVVPPVLS
jgi:predicted nucleic acid-binding protein